MGRKIWILSEDKKLYKWASKAFSAKILAVRIPFDDIPSITRPTLILLGCDYQCQYELCSRKFLIPIQFPDVPYRFARTILLRNPSLSSRSYLLSPPEFLWSNQPEGNTEESRQSEKTFHSLKCFVNKIRLCHRLGELILTNRSYPIYFSSKCK
jgi:hypothetical protein